MGVDDNLLAEKSFDSANNSSEDEKTVSASSQENPNQQKTLRETVRAEKAKKTAAEEKNAVESEKGSALSRGTSSLLRSAWTNLITSFGLTLIWIDAHILLRQIFGKSLFCKLGAEWTDKIGAQAKTAKETKMLTIVEPMGVAFCNLGCLIIILSVMAIISAITGITGLLLDAVKNLF
jgi:hypothetical protein